MLKFSLAGQEVATPVKYRLVRKADGSALMGITDSRGVAQVSRSDFESVAMHIRAACVSPAGDLYWLSTPATRPDPDVPLQLDLTRLSVVTVVVTDSNGGRMPGLAVRFDISMNSDSDPAERAAWRDLVGVSHHRNLRTDAAGEVRVEGLGSEQIFFIHVELPRGTSETFESALVPRGSTGRCFSVSAPGEYPVLVRTVVNARVRVSLPKAVLAAALVDPWVGVILERRGFDASGQPKPYFDGDAGRIGPNGTAEFEIRKRGRESPANLGGARLICIGFADGVGFGYLCDTLDLNRQDYQPQFGLPEFGHFVSGKVVDSVSRRPIQGVRVECTCSLFGSSSIAVRTTDALGAFRVDGLPPPRWNAGGALPQPVEFAADLRLSRDREASYSVAKTRTPLEIDGEVEIRLAPR